MRKDSLGDRIKGYEGVSKSKLTRRVPVIIRVDGKAFHTFTRGMEKPFSQDLINSMVCGAVNVAQSMQGFKAAYIQSDEATFLLTDYETHETQAWFDYSVNKLVSISASTMSMNFFAALQEDTGMLPVFDSRAFNVPREDVVNTFLWRAQDWERNSLQMYARAHFSHKELHKKNRADIHEMLHHKGLNWAKDLTPQERNGTFLFKTADSIVANYGVVPSYTSISAYLDPYLRGMV